MGGYIRFFLSLVLVSAILWTSCYHEVQEATGEVYTTQQTSQVDEQRTEIGALQLTILGVYTFQVVSTKKLSDVEVTVYKEGKEYLKQKTNSNGEISFQLPVGAYTYKQTSERTSDFFAADATEYPLEIKNDGQVSKHIIYNRYIYF
ncbi:putative cell wall anchor protein (plasmid) [Bacillus thuringiensis YBT-1518]|uniref:Cell wall anchor protein n=1 Tax=Bacillus thuringiensis YBT-1518 TaxID=529122 RepID=A0A9W3PJG0_BACTU|nr:SpaA isopeptide-forming pilin-related protein [Bacillus thuringiensis]AHA75444.1 putative cell wall anchor protein [Bacillus thuringiensis YBT-1518]